MGEWPFASLYVAEVVATAHCLFAYMMFSVSHWVKDMFCQLLASKAEVAVPFTSFLASDRCSWLEVCPKIHLPVSRNLGPLVGVEDESHVSHTCRLLRACVEVDERPHDVAPGQENHVGLLDAWRNLPIARSTQRAPGST